MVNGCRPKRLTLSIVLEPTATRAKTAKEPFLTRNLRNACADDEIQKKKYARMKKLGWTFLTAGSLSASKSPNSWALKMALQLRRQRELQLIRIVVQVRDFAPIDFVMSTDPCGRSIEHSPLLHGCGNS